MAKLVGPLHSLEASGAIGDAIRYVRQRGQNRAVYRQTGTAARLIGQRRQATIISEGARLWKTPSGKGPEKTYQSYVAGLSRNDWFFYHDAILMEWSYDQLMVIT